MFSDENIENGWSQIWELIVIALIVILSLLACSLLLRCLTSRLNSSALNDETEVLDWGLECSERFDAVISGNRIILQKRELGQADETMV